MEDLGRYSRCVGFEEYERSIVDRFHCPGCRLSSGPNTKRTSLLQHRHNFAAEDEKDLPTEVGTPKFLAEFEEEEAKIPEA